MRFYIDSIWQTILSRPTYIHLTYTVELSSRGPCSWEQQWQFGSAEILTNDLQISIALLSTELHGLSFNVSPVDSTGFSPPSDYSYLSCCKIKFKYIRMNFSSATF